MGKTRKPCMRNLLVLTLVCMMLFSASYTRIGKSDDQLPIDINSGATYTTSTIVTLILNYPPAVMMRFSNDYASWSDWELYGTSKVWNLSDDGDGPKTVYVEFQYESFPFIETSEDSITLDKMPPSSTVSTLSSYQTSASFPIFFTSDDATSGVANVHLWVKTPGFDFYDIGVWVSGDSYTANDGDGSYQFYTIATDEAGNHETALTLADASTILDTSNPSGSIVINDGATSTASTSVTLDLSASLDTQFMKFSTDSGSTWTEYEAYSIFKQFTLPVSDGEKAVQVMFKDRAGLESTEIISDSIVLDTSTPETNIAYSGTLGSNDWYTSAVTATMTATDSGDSDVKEIHYVLDAGTEQIVSGNTANFNVETAGIHSLSYWAVDNGGNVETPANTASVKIDLSSPMTSAILSGDLLSGETDWYTGPVTVTLNPVDANSGVVNTYYSLDGGTNYEEYNNTPFDITEQGTTLIYYYSTDNAGYTETAKTTAVNIAYPVTFTVSGLPAGTSWSVKLGDTTKSSTESTINLQAKTGSTSWSVDNPISGGSGTRYYASGNQGVLNVPTETAVVIPYVKQYYLTVSSAYGTPTGTGWYETGATANFGIPRTVSDGPGIQYTFTMWTGSSSSTNPTASILMNSPKAVTANWLTQYQVSFNVAPTGSGTTSPSSSKWVNAGDTLSISAEANGDYNFKSWTSTAGTIGNSASQSTTAVITGTGMVTANFELKQTSTPTPTPTPTSNPTPAPTAAPTGSSTVHPTRTPRPTPSPSPSPTPSINLTTIPVSLVNGSTIEFSITGNITASQITHATISTDPSNSKTIISFTLTGTSGFAGLSNITIPKNAIPFGTTPIVYIDSKQAQSQGQIQDVDNYYVWYVTSFSTHSISIIFNDNTQSDLPWGLIQSFVVVLIITVFAMLIVIKKSGK